MIDKHVKTTLVHTTPNMPLHTFKDAKAQKAVRFLVNGLRFSVLEVMRAARFLDAQTSDRTLQQLVCRLYQRTPIPGVDPNHHCLLCCLYNVCSERNILCN